MSNLSKVVLNIRGAIVIQSPSGPDTIMLDTDLPGGCFPFTESQSISIVVARNSGVEYCVRHFNIEPRLVGNGVSPNGQSTQANKRVPRSVAGRD